MDDSAKIPQGELQFDRGTLVLAGLPHAAVPPLPKIWRWREETSQWHTDAYRYQSLKGTVEIVDHVPNWNPQLLSTRLLRDYQNGAKDEWFIKVRIARSSHGHRNDSRWLGRPRDR